VRCERCMCVTDFCCSDVYIVMGGRRDGSVCFLKVLLVISVVVVVYLFFLCKEVRHYVRKREDEIVTPPQCSTA
jgi:uncharacterized membrane protein